MDSDLGMIMKNRLVATGALLAACAAVAQGQTSTPAKPASTLVNGWLREGSPAFEAWDIGGQFRLRYESFSGANAAFPTRDFQRTGVDNDNNFLLLREKIHVGYTPVPWVTAYVEARDSSAAWDEAPTNPGTDVFDLHQAYLRLGDPKQFPVTLKVGRQELIYGDERLIGASDWGNVPRSFDAAKLRYEKDGNWVDLFTGRVVLADNHNFNVVDDYDWFSGFYGSCKDIVPDANTEVYVLSRNSGAGTAAAGTRGTAVAIPQNSAAGTPRDIYSIGTRVQSHPGKWKGWDYTLEFVQQLGSINVAGKRLDQDARAVAATVGYTFNQVSIKPRVSVGFDYSSGDDNPNDGTSHTLDNLFPTNHKHYGMMDYIGWRNIQSPRVGLSAKPAKGLSVSADYLLFRLDDDRDLFYPQGGGGRSALGYGRNSGFSKFIGSELDLDATYVATQWLSFRGGYGHFFAAGYLEDSKAKLGGSADADWVYIQTTFTF